MRPSPNLCAISPLHDSVTPNTAVAALHIPQSLEIWCLWINDIVGYQTKWWGLHGNGPILWSLQTLFTSPALSSIFNILHPSDTPIIKTLQYFNSEPTSYIHTNQNINALFFKTTDASIFYWIQDITSVLSYVILHNYLFYHVTLWIPRTHLPTSLKYFCLNIISRYLPTSC